jgi:hypothetical protein
MLGLHRPGPARGERLTKPLFDLSSNFWTQICLPNQFHFERDVLEPVRLSILGYWSWE